MVELDDMTLKRALTGERQAFKLLYDHYAPFLWKVLYTLSSRDMHTTSELLQDTFVKVHGAGKQFKGKSSFSTWLYRIAYTTAIGYQRKQRSHAVYDAFSLEQLQSNDRADSYDEKEITLRILASLSAEERFLLTSRELDALSFDELAAITGRTSGALRTELSRLKERIRMLFPMESTLATGGAYA